MMSATHAPMIQKNVCMRAHTHMRVRRLYKKNLWNIITLNFPKVQ